MHTLCPKSSNACFLVLSYLHKRSLNSAIQSWLLLSIDKVEKKYVARLFCYFTPALGYHRIRIFFIPTFIPAWANLSRANERTEESTYPSIWVARKGNFFLWYQAVSHSQVSVHLSTVRVQYQSVCTAPPTYSSGECVTFATGILYDMCSSRHFPNWLPIR